METLLSTQSPRDHSAIALQSSDGATAQRDFSHIQGWGADLDHKNRPAYPMERTPPRLEGAQRTQPVDQPVRSKVYHSVERPGITPIFGTSTPPSGLSGKIRDVAYKLSENDIRHWLLLLLADRVNVVEGIGQDLSSGHIPNIFSEMGAKAELRYNPAGLARKAAIASAVVGIGYYLIKAKKK
ncbi:MAG: hypothetical protein JWP38_3061 [Herbaspirillum sp.]|jgi:hypothetical protein|nr:hypothetical protein [Herbaspirillum sp.]